MLDAGQQLSWHLADLPPPGHGEVLTQTRLSAISVASELSLVVGNIGTDFPIRLGYQTLGTVEAVGQGVGLPLGTRVISTAGHVSAAVLREAAVIPVPGHVPDGVALATILGEETHNGIRKLAPQPHERVLIAGAGLLGLLTLFNLTRRGINNVSVIEPDIERQALARAFGAVQVAAPGELGEADFDVGLECSASPDGFAELLSRLRREGRACVLSDGNWGTLNLPSAFHANELSVMASSDGEDYAGYAEWLWANTEPLLARLFETRIAAADLPAAFHRLQRWPRPVSLVADWTVTLNRAASRRHRLVAMTTFKSLGQEKLETLMREWQALLGLGEWTLRLELVKFKRPWQSGDVKIDPVHKAALLLLTETPFRDEEETLVHELVHVVLWPLDTAAMDLTEALGPDESPAREFARSTVFRALEPVTEQLALAFLRTRGHQSAPAWTVLEHEAAERADGQFKSK